MSQGQLVRVGAYLAVFVVGCGGTTSGGSSGSSGNGSIGNPNCKTVAPCGGDVTGTWKITSVCQAPESVDLGDAGTCSGLSLQVTLLDYEGSVTFSGGTFMSTLTSGEAGETLTEPTSCLGQNTSSQTCAELSVALQQNDAGATGTCSISGSNCVCNGTQTIPPQTSSGTYTIGSTSITLTLSTAGSTPETDGYCIQGNTMYLDASAASVMAGASLGGLVLTKQ